MPDRPHPAKLKQRQMEEECFAPLRAKSTNRIPRKSNSKVENLHICPLAAAGPTSSPATPYYSLAPLRSCRKVLYESFYQLGRRRVSIWGSETASRCQEIEFQEDFEDFSIFSPMVILGCHPPRPWNINSFFL